MKTLNAIQTLCKIGKVLSKIIYICCMVAFIVCAVGVVAMLIGEQSIKIGGTTLHGILESEAGANMGTSWAAIVVGLILSAGEYVVARMAYRYFDHELNAGTPFTLEGAKELMRLGISAIWIPIVSHVLAQVAHDVIGKFMENVEAISLDNPDSVTLGIMFICISLLCRYGAESDMEKGAIRDEGEI